MFMLIFYLPKARGGGGPRKTGKGGGIERRQPKQSVRITNIKTST